MKKTVRKETNKRGPINQGLVPFLIKFPPKTKKLLNKIASYHRYTQTKIIVDLVEKERNKYEKVD